MNSRRRLVLAGAGLPLVLASGGNKLAGSLAALAPAATPDYRAVVCLFLNGGNDGNDTLVPLDGAYADYAAARPGLALSKNALVALPGTTAGHQFGVHPALAPIASLYAQRRLAWVANVGPLVVPATARQVLDRAVDVPPFLLSHSDQVATQQGWTGDADPSGWAGRALEALPAPMRHNLSAVTMDSNRTLVLGRSSRVSYMSPSGSRYWGAADLTRPEMLWTQSLFRMAELQSANAFRAEYARTLDGALEDASDVADALLLSAAPQGNFGADTLARSLRLLAQVLPTFKTLGYRRQVFLVNWGAFDTHARQRGSDPTSQDSQLDIVARAVAAFDSANRASGVDTNVVTLMMTDFGRTLKPASGAGTDHAWGNHWFVLGGSVVGGQVYGRFPVLQLGGPDDGDRDREGRFVPSTATDQVGATLMQWMGLPAENFDSVFPNLSNFSQKFVQFLQT